MSVQNTKFKTQHFVTWFRAAAPYIHAFGGRTFVIAFGGEVVSEGEFVALAHDVNLLNALDVRVILVHGARPQIEADLKERGATVQYDFVLIQPALNGHGVDFTHYPRMLKIDPIAHAKRFGSDKITTGDPNVRAGHRRVG